MYLWSKRWFAHNVSNSSCSVFGSARTRPHSFGHLPSNSMRNASFSISPSCQNWINNPAKSTCPGKWKSTLSCGACTNGRLINFTKPGAELAEKFSKHKHYQPKRKKQRSGPGGEEESMSYSPQTEANNAIEEERFGGFSWVDHSTVILKRFHETAEQTKSRIRLNRAIFTMTIVWDRSQPRQKHVHVLTFLQLERVALTVNGGPSCCCCCSSSFFLCARQNRIREVARYELIHEG